MKRIAPLLSVFSLVVAACGTPGDGAEDDPSGAPRVGFTTTSFVATGDTVIEVPLALSRAVDGDVNLMVFEAPPELADGQWPAMSGTDYTFEGAGPSVRIPAGEKSVTLRIRPIPSTEAGPDRVITLSISMASGPSGMIDVAAGQDKVRILIPNTVKPIASVRYAESQWSTLLEEGDEKVLNATLSLNEAMSRPLAFRFKSTGSAVFGEDFTTSLGESFTLPAGERSLAFTIDVLDDDEPEGLEAFTLTLESADDGAAIDPEAATLEGGITTNGWPTLAMSAPAEIDEDAGTQTVTITLSKAVTTDIVLTYEATASQLAEDAWSLLDPTTLTIEAGQTSAELRFSVTSDGEFGCGGSLSFRIASYVATAFPDSPISLGAMTTIAVSNVDEPVAGTNDLTVGTSVPTSVGNRHQYGIFVHHPGEEIARAVNLSAYESFDFTMSAELADGLYQVIYYPEMVWTRPVAATVSLSQRHSCETETFEVSVVETSRGQPVLFITKSGDTWSASTTAPPP